MADQERMTLYRGCTPVVDEWHEPDGNTTIVETLAEAVAEAEGVDVTEVSPLYDVVDLDALTKLVERGDQAADAKSVFAFEFGNWNVFVREDGRVRVCDGTRPTSPAPVFAGTTP